MHGIFDGDCASLSFGHDDLDTARRNGKALVSAVVTNPGVMRQMPRLLRYAGLALVASCSYVLAQIGEADAWASALHRDSEAGVSSGAATITPTWRGVRSVFTHSPGSPP